MRKLSGNMVYALKTMRWDLLFLPIVLWMTFVFIVWIKGNSGVEKVVGGFIGFGLPLSAGIMASSVFLDIPPLEIIFSLPRSALVFISERLIIIFIIISIAATTFQLLMKEFGIDLIFMGTVFNRQMAWILPTIILINIGCCSSLLITHSTGGAMVVSLVWILEIVAHELFMQSAISRQFFVFLSVYQPYHSDLVDNYVSLIIVFLFLFLLSGFLLRKPERII